ncbi:hypothetical protein EV586_101846 [Tumebacillus sp. BK434]|uniref:hypothetical protein n=1 Tax=Tumebacillus sp. BK434 TaxID=2512169 RepID=UPI001052E222|nr:hypothetical protein [Tumebacillus sp. BK434]TCP59617.1 hypothetical protein EV586_101846 [Tumebacillus sp. BK434]
MTIQWRSVLLPYLEGFRQAIDLSVAALLLSGQITIRSVIVSPSEEIRLNVTGPIFGGGRTVAKGNRGDVDLIIDAANIVAAYLLILNQINVSGVFLQSQRFTMTLGGPVLGSPKTVANLPAKKKTRS